MVCLNIEMCLQDWEEQNITRLKNLI
jgi:hypothetical protein